MKKILAVFTALLAFIAATAIASEIDKRQVLTLNEPQRDHILKEMRALLSGTQRILEALSKEDMVAVAEHARALGMGMAHKGENHLQSVLPKEFMQLGMSVHKAFDEIAADAESRKDPRHTLRQLSESMMKCSTCHVTYQIRVREESNIPSGGPAAEHFHDHH
ncbi:hypothetical protein [Nitrosospira multiformis]|uniref:Cytochrome C n=1 Tax=Nitrosospira multiformis (strain ATCC 25196 / NCIMB 11849 / C 71) TaxID=323848 RepID=Q2Y7J6_NITMU|nr:hypothetical protein [Nitrosospira multiformis]ABB75275.1 conserved hypothetical protein [Nitrosospira multiformis ATCC 25196]SDZ94088.1 hypothetical protein SAMN05216411_10346 [Nitrosospira multiformis]SEF58994.1 hypothetical protein SAMN05216403_10434 [Nitrosospira multiformis ATCC 25196]